MQSQPLPPGCILAESEDRSLLHLQSLQGIQGSQAGPCLHSSWGTLPLRQAETWDPLQQCLHWKECLLEQWIMKKLCLCAQSLQLSPTPCTRMSCSPPGSSVRVILQARILERVAVPSSRGSSPPRNLTHISCVSCTAGKFFINWATWEAPQRSYNGLQMTTWCTWWSVAKLCPAPWDLDRLPLPVTWRLLCPWDFPGKNTRVGCHFLLQGIFPTQGLNPRLLHCRQILYHWASREARYMRRWGK